MLFNPRETPRLKRWHLVPRNWIFNLWLHKLKASDDTGKLHNHPWNYLTIVLRRPYREHFGNSQSRIVGRINFRSGEVFHRIELLSDKPSWTIFITFPRINRDWELIKET